MRVRWFDATKLATAMRDNKDLAREWSSPAHLSGWQADERLRAVARRAYARRRRSPSYWLDRIIGRITGWLKSR